MEGTGSRKILRDIPNELPSTSLHREKMEAGERLDQQDYMDSDGTSDDDMLPAVRELLRGAATSSPPHNHDKGTLSPKRGGNQKAWGLLGATREARNEIFFRSQAYRGRGRRRGRRPSGSGSNRVSLGSQSQSHNSSHEDSHPGTFPNNQPVANRPRWLLHPSRVLDPLYRLSNGRPHQQQYETSKRNDNVPRRREEEEDRRYGPYYPEQTRENKSDWW